MGQNITNKQPPNPQSLWNSKGPHVDAVIWKVKEWICIRQLWEISQRSG